MEEAQVTVGHRRIESGSKRSPETPQKQCSMQNAECRMKNEVDCSFSILDFAFGIVHPPACLAVLKSATGTDGFDVTGMKRKMKKSKNVFHSAFCILHSALLNLTAIPPISGPSIRWSKTPRPAPALPTIARVSVRSARCATPTG